MSGYFKRARKGFTLIELLVSIVVIAVLAMIIIPHFQDSGRRSKESSLHSDLAELRSAVASYQADTGYYPTALTDLTATTAPANGDDSTGTSQTIAAANWHGPYITTGIPTDPVSGNAFTYTATSPNVGKVVSSATGNGLDGTAYSTW